MVTEAFLINPPKKKPAKRRKKAVKRRVYKTAARATKRKTRRKKGIGREGSIHRPVVYTKGGHWVTSKKGRLTRPGVRVNPAGGLMLMGNKPKRRRKYKRNPSGLLGMLPTIKGINLGHIIPLALTGGLSVIATGMAPNFVPVQSQWARYGVQAAVGVGGGIVLNKAVRGQHGTIWAVSSFAVIAVDLIQKHVLTRLGLAGYGDVGAFPYETGVGAYTEEYAQPELAVDPYPYGGEVLDY